MGENGGFYAAAFGRLFLGGGVLLDEIFMLRRLLHLTLLNTHRRIILFHRLLYELIGHD